MMNLVRAFSSDYAQARVQFLEGSAASGLQVQSHVHPLLGAQGETLAMDVARFGSAKAKHLLIVSSACHGAEGFCGSGVQTFALHDTEWRTLAGDAGVAVLYIHALNPHGFSHLRRVTHENVDLNRNFQDFSKPLPPNSDYRSLHAALLPQQWPASSAIQAELADFIAQRGLAAYQAAVTQGQYEFADGLFFGGTAPTWSNTTLRAVLHQHGACAERIGWIDLHTGLGPSGHGERICAGPDDAANLQRAKAWWDGEQDGQSGQSATPVTSMYDGSSTSSPLTGLMWSSIHQECPQAEYTGMALEFGTVPIESVLDALRADHWLNSHPDAPQEQAVQIKQQIKAAFYVDTDLWKGQVVSQARQAMFQAVAGLSA